MVVKKRGPYLSIARILICLFTGIATGIILFLVFGTDRFTLEKIDFHGGTSLPADSLEVVESSMLGKNLLTISLDSVRDRLLRFPEIREVVFKRRLWGHIDCYLMQREPVAIIAGDRLFEVDSEGVVIPLRAGRADIDLPVITGISKADLGTEKGKKRLRMAVTVLETLKDYGFSTADELSEIHVQNNEVMLVLMRTGTLVRLGSENFAKRIQKLYAVYGVLDDEGSFPDMIDLRFNRQVVVR
jgi:cell division septal protein FtsQ